MIKKISILILLLTSTLTVKAQVIDAKINVLAASVAIVNPSLEVGFGKHSAVAADFLGVFAPKNYMGTGYPFEMTMVLLEYRYYVSKNHRGFFTGANFGWNNFRMNKNVIPFVNHDHNKDTYDVGSGRVFGINLGYKFVFAERFGLELSVAGGWQHTKHEKYNNEGVRLVEMNGSGEWLLYKAGITFSYRFGSSVKAALANKKR